MRSFGDEILFGIGTVKPLGSFSAPFTMKIDSSSGLFGRVLIGELMLRAINATLAASYSSTL